MSRFKDYSQIDSIERVDRILVWDTSSVTTNRVRPSRCAALVFADLPTADNSFDGWTIFVTDGRKSGEGAAAGTGILAVFDGSSGEWRGVLSEVEVTI